MAGTLARLLLEETRRVFESRGIKLNENLPLIETDFIRRAEEIGPRMIQLYCLAGMEIRNSSARRRTGRSAGATQRNADDQNLRLSSMRARAL